MKRYKILRIITNSEAEPGGAANHVYQLSSRLNSVFETMVVCGTGRRLVKRLKKARVPVLTLPLMKRSPSPLLDIACVCELRRIIKEGKFDIVAAHSTKAGLIGRVAAALAGAPLVVFTAHGFSFNEPSGMVKHRLMLWQERLGARLGDHIVAVSEYDRRAALAEKVCGEDGITTIHNGIDLAKFDLENGSTKQKLGFSTADRVVGTIANFYPNKGLGFFIDAFEVVSRELKDAHAVIIGDGPTMPAVRARAKAKGLAGKVRFLGYRDDAARFLHAFDVFALSSVKEGFPWALLEAMAVARPIAATSVGGVSEMVGETALLVPPREPASLGSAILGLLSGRERAFSLGAAARERVAGNFTIERMIQKTEKLYLNLLERKDR